MNAIVADRLILRWYMLSRLLESAVLKQQKVKSLLAHVLEGGGVDLRSRRENAEEGVAFQQVVHRGTGNDGCLKPVCLAAAAST